MQNDRIPLHAASYNWCTIWEMRVADMTFSANDIHNCNRKAKFVASERYVKKILNTFSIFTNSFKVNHKALLQCFSFVTAAPENIADDLLKADTTREALSSAFVNKVFMQKGTSFHDPINKTTFNLNDIRQHGKNKETK